MIKIDAGCYFGTLMTLNILIGVESVCKDMIKKLIGMYVRFLHFNYLSIKNSPDSQAEKYKNGINRRTSD